MPSILATALLAASLQDGTDAARPESGALMPLILGVLALGLLLGVLRFLYLRARGPRRRAD